VKGATLQMAFYDHFHASPTSSITPIGRMLVDVQNQYFVDLIRQFWGNSPSVLEIGCGHGFFADQCRRNRLAYKAVEANAKMAQDLSVRGFHVYQSVVPPLTVQERFDVIFMDQVFEHMRGRDEAIALIQSCKDHLNNMGILVICSPDIFTAKEDFFSDYTHNYPTSMPVLTQILEDGGFQVVYQNYSSFLIRGQLLTRMFTLFVRLLYGIGLFHLLFRKRARKAKTALLPSCVIIGRSISDVPAKQ
jgi:SAM-dependent methyltransferase